MLSVIVGMFLFVRLLDLFNVGIYADPPEPPVILTTTTTSPSPASIPAPPVSRSEWDPSQYGCHSDGRCLDVLDEWCDEQDTAPFGNDGFVCEPVRDLDVVWDPMSGRYEWMWDTYDDEDEGYDDPGYDDSGYDDPGYDDPGYDVP